ncbi:hypothetical protein V2J09_020464 [Rumex salicifolius]
MDLETETSALESIGDNDVVCSANLSVGDDVKSGSNGSYDHYDDGCDLNSNGNGHPLPSLDPVETEEDAHKLNSDKNGYVKLQSESNSLHSNHSTSGECVEAVTAINSAGNGSENDQSVLASPSSPQKVLPGSPGQSPLATGTKGKGLKKWRRIRREVTKDSTASLDVTKVLKRGSENFQNSSDVAPEMKQKSEGSISSTIALIDNTVGADTFSMDGPNSSYEGVGGSTFNVGADSDNSKDRSSKSSTAASAPRHRHDASRVSGHSREKQRMKHLVGKSPVNASQRLQQAAFQANTCKKPWVEAVNMDKENSYSSLESDSRSYISVFMQGSSSVMNNGHGERLMGYDSEHGYDGPAGEQFSVDGRPTGSNTSVREIEEFSQSDAASSWQVRGRSENDQLSGNGDPLVDSVRMLLSAQEALEQEIKKIGELGKDLLPVNDNSIRAVPSNWATPEDAARGDSDSMEAKSTIQAQNIQELEKKLEEAFSMLKEKESRIAELEAAVNDVKQSNEDLRRSVEMQQKKHKETETEMEGLFKQKMEAEAKYLAAEDKRMAAEKQMNLLLGEQKSPVSTQSPAKTDITETKPEMSKDKAEAAISTQIEIRKMRTKAAKFSLVFLVQLILLILLLNFFASQFLPKSEMQFRHF